MSNREKENDKVYQKGQLIIKVLDVAVHLLDHFSDRDADTAILNTRERIENDLLDDIIDLATLCCGSDRWDDVLSYISESGVQLPGAFCAKMESLNASFDFN